MAEKITFEDQTQTPKSRPRPEVRRPVGPTPGGLPLPPSKQPTASSSRFLLESGTSSISTKCVASSISGTRSISTDLFGLPEFKFPIAYPLKTTDGQPCAGFSSIKSPTHLPGMANLKVPSLLESFSSKSRCVGSKKIKLPKPSDFNKSVLDLKSRDESLSNALGVSTAKDLPKPSQRPTDLSRFKSDAPVIKHASDPVSIDRFRVLKLKTKDLKKSTNTIGQVSDADCSSNQHVELSVAERKPEYEKAAISLPQGVSTSVQPDSSANIDSPQPQDLNLVAKRSSDPTPPVSQSEASSEIKRSGESMPIITQHPDVLTKSKSIFDRLKRFMRRGLGVKKKVGKEDEEESTGLVFEKDETEQFVQSETRPKEDDKKYKPFPTDTYNYFLAIDPILPKGEVEAKCRIVGNIPYDSPTESVMSSTSSSKSESSVTGPESCVEKLSSKSYPVSPATDRTLESTTMSLSIERPLSQSSPVSPDIERT